MRLLIAELRRAEVTEAAAAGGAGPRGRGVRSMWDVPRLAMAWQGLQHGGLLDVAATRARPTVEAVEPAELVPDTEGLLTAAAAVLTEVVSGPPHQPWQQGPAAAVLPIMILLAAWGEAPADVVLRAEAVRPIQTVLAELTAFGVLRAAPGWGGPTVVPAGRRLLAVAVLQRLEELAAADDEIDDDDDLAYAERIFSLR